MRQKADIDTAVQDLKPKLDRIKEYRDRMQETKDTIIRNETKQITEIDKRLKLLVELLEANANTLKTNISKKAAEEKQRIDCNIKDLNNIVENFEDIQAEALKLSRHGSDKEVADKAEVLLAQMTKDWSPSVPFKNLKTSWKEDRVELNKITDMYSDPHLIGKLSEVTNEISFHYELLSFSGAKVSATEMRSFPSGLEEWNRTQFCASNDGGIYMSGKSNMKWIIQKRNQSGDIMWKTNWFNLDRPSKPCGLQEIQLASKKYLAASLAAAHKVVLYDPNPSINSESTITAFSHEHLSFNQMCLLPPNTLLVLAADRANPSKKIFFLTATKSKEPSLFAARNMETYMVEAYGICVVPSSKGPFHNLIIVTAWQRPGCIKAFSAESGEVVWERSGEIAGVQCNPHGVCADRRGHVYIADGKNRRVLVLDAETGWCNKCLNCYYI